MGPRPRGPPGGCANRLPAATNPAMSTFAFINASWRSRGDASFVPRYRSLARKRRKVPEMRIFPPEVLNRFGGIGGGTPLWGSLVSCARPRGYARLPAQLAGCQPAGPRGYPFQPAPRTQFTLRSPIRLSALAPGAKFPGAAAAVEWKECESFLLLFWPLACSPPLRSNWANRSR